MKAKNKSAEELKAFKSNMTDSHFAPNINKLYLWTQRGANRHSKILDTDKVSPQFWGVNRLLSFSDEPSIKFAPRSGCVVSKNINPKLDTSFATSGKLAFII